MLRVEIEGKSLKLREGRVNGKGNRGEGLGRINVKGRNNSIYNNK